MGFEEETPDVFGRIPLIQRALVFVTAESGKIFRSAENDGHERAANWVIKAVQFV